MNRYLYALSLSLLLLGLSACFRLNTPQPPTAEPAPGEPTEPAPAEPQPLDPTKNYGLVEIFFEAVGSETQRSSSHQQAPGNLTTQSLTNVGAGFQLRYLSNGYFDTDGSEVSDPDVACDYTNGARYLYATYEVRNAEFASGTAYTDAAENVTMLAVDTNAAVNGTNAVGSIKKFDGSNFSNPAAITDCIKPTHGLQLLPQSGLSVETEQADFQAFKEVDLPAPADLGVDEVFPYGFVVRNKTTNADRILPANPDADDYAGVVTFAVRLPRSAVKSNDPYSFSMIFMMLTDDTTRVTEGVEEQGGSGAEARADALGNVLITTLGDSGTSVTGNTLRRVCDLRTAGTKASPEAYLANGSTGVCSSYPGGIIYVDDSAAGANDGSSWGNAFTTLQDAIDAWGTAGGGLELWVAAGAYYPDEGASQTDGDRNSTFTLRSGLELYGGFAGTETLRDERDPDANLTVLSGDIDKNDTNTDGNAVAESTTDLQGANAYSVITGTDMAGSARLDGFTVTAGQADGAVGEETEGGGLYLRNGSATLENITFTGNSAVRLGGAINLASETVLSMRHATFLNNAAANGGAINNDNSSLNVNDTWFEGNTAAAAGGAVNNGSSASYSGGGASFSNVTFIRNTSNALTFAGGAVYNEFVHTSFNNVAFIDNSALRGTGGAVINRLETYSSFTNVAFIGNSAPRSGGAMFNLDDDPQLVNVVFAANAAGENGGAIFNEGGSPTVVNASFTNNTASGTGGAVYSKTYFYTEEHSTPMLSNSIFYNNTAGDPAADSPLESEDANSQPVLNHSYFSSAAPAVYDTTNSSNNLFSQGDPFFNVSDPDGLDDTLATSDDGLRLRNCSAAIDQGDNSANTEPTDFMGNPRKVDVVALPDVAGQSAPVIDMGAYEEPDPNCD